ncbi:DNA mismatch repair protein MutT [Saccharothrix yanglingensis]|uniref:DNA mismatch repair protein MutT n=1 Tax=Saccharothrix yanglingensis TaxID=659496 RepID=A0ABU0WX44_9PSEU|nr:DNA mismatch repair protein MutT [Saccharothrix yanglingensis]
MHRHLVDVHVKLVRGDGRVLLIRRRDPDPRFDGKWHLPAGKVEAGESAPAAAVREVAEEVGVRIQDVKIFHVTHAVAPGVEGRVGFFLEAGGWEGEPVVREPDRCSGIGWFALSDLPDDLLGCTAIGLSADEPFSVVGWERDT